MKVEELSQSQALSYDTCKLMRENALQKFVAETEPQFKGRPTGYCAGYNFFTYSHAEDIVKRGRT